MGRWVGCCAFLGLSFSSSCQAGTQVINRKLKCAKAKKIRQAKQDARLGLYRACNADVAIALYIPSGYDAGVAGKFVTQRTRWNRRRRKGVQWSARIPALFLQSSVTVQSVLAPSNPQEVKRLARAITFLSEESTLTWVKHLNFNVGWGL